MNRNTFNQCISEHRFRDLFIELEWNNSRGDIYIDIGETEYTFQCVAEMRGFRVLTCEVEAIPPTALCKRIDTKLRPSAQDYILIYYTDSSEHQKWVIPVRKVDKRDLVTIEYQSANQADCIFNKLNGICFDGVHDITLPDVKASIQQVFAVNSEKITKDFFREFQTEHKAFLSMISGLDDYIEDKKNRNKDWYTSVMLNRLMFCYFIQKKGFLDGNVNYLHEKLLWMQGIGRNQFFGSFYKGFLCSLFHDGLNSPRHKEDFREKYGRIPYLNGGMFDEHQLEQEYKDIDIKDEAFERLFTFFDKWNWHLDTRLTASGKDINPDVLGYIFEQYINDRAQMGAYYTKEDITEYIGKNCILPFVMDKVAKTSSSKDFKTDGFVWQTLRESGDRYIYDAVKKGYSADWQQCIPDYIYKGIDTNKPNLIERRSRWNEKTSEEFALPTEIWRETVERLQRCDTLLSKISGGEIKEINDFITYNLDIRTFVEDLVRKTDDHLFVEHTYQALRSVTILDPTCGSGAFLFAALNILEPLYEACLDRMEEWHKENPRLFENELAEIQNHYRSNRQYFIYKNIILRNLYGVDIMVEATEIAKLRLFLKMVAVVDVDYRADNMGLDPLPDIDFNIKCGNTLVGYPTQKELEKHLMTADMFARQEFQEKIEDKMTVVAKAYSLFRSEQLRTYDDNASLKETKKQLKERLEELNDLLNRHLYTTITDGKNYDYEKWLASHQPFHWIAEFYEIMHGNGGFDVIIGNPPYVVYTKKDKVTKKSIADCYSVKKYKTIECNNLYGFVMERSHYLTNNEKRIGMIVPLSFTAAKNMKSLRDIYTESKSIYVSSYEIRPAKLFDGGKGADQRLNIFISHTSPKTCIRTTEVLRWHSENRNLLFTNLNYALSLGGERIYRYSNPIEESIAAKYNANRQISCLFNDLGKYHVHYRSAGLRYWIIFLNEGFGTDSTSNHKKSVEKENVSKQLMAILNSNLYWWYYATNFDMFNQTDSNISEFRYTFKDNATLVYLASSLEKDMDSNKQVSIVKKQDGETNESYAYQKKLSKSIIDEIDKVLAKHYGFTEEELDFIINYDIKYRMGDELNTEE